MEMLRLAAFKGLVVDKAFKVNVDDIAVFSAAVLNSDGAGVAVAHPLDFGVDLFVGDGVNLLGSLDALVILNGDVGLDNADSLHRDAVFLGNLGHFDLGANDNLQAGFVVSGLQHFRRQVVDSLFKEDAFAVELFDGLAGGFALPEAGDLELFGSLLKDLIAGGGKILCGNRNDQFVFAVFGGVFRY